MAQTTWEKAESTIGTSSRSGGQLKFIVGGVLALAAVAYLIINGMTSGARYFITIDELLKEPKYVGQTVRVSGAVIGDTIQYDGPNLIIDFTIAHIAQENNDLAEALYIAANDPSALTLKVHIENQVKPDLLTHEAQAIVTGKLGEDGVFYANELLLKCPSRYGESDPAKAIAEPVKK